MSDFTYLDRTSARAPSKADAPGESGPGAPWTPPRDHPSATNWPTRTTRLSPGWDAARPPART